ncbi:MAG: TRL-like family protein [Leptospiraceae bacterium]|nr:TRL-like family protein [Leptospiraceae bacterium]
MKRLFLIPLIVLLNACIYTNVKSPGWYYSQNYTDVKELKIVGKLSGKSCSKSYVWAVYTGDESFDSAVSNAIKGKADMLFNVQTDYQIESYFFFIYARRCTKVTGIGVKFPGEIKKIEAEL